MAQTDYFLKVTGIDGESTSSGMEKAIPVQSWSWGETNASSVGSATAGAGAGKVSVQDLHFTTLYSQASPKLFMACAQGQHIPKAQLFCRKAGGSQETFLTISLTDCFVTSYQTGGSGGSDIIPMDQVSIAFGKMELEYKSQSKDGTTVTPIKAGYDVKANKKV